MEDGVMKKGFAITIIALAAASCSGFLEPYPSAVRSEQYVLSNPTTLTGLIGECYEYMSKNYDNNEGAFLDCATDNAVRTSLTDGITRFAIGLASPNNDLFQTYWERDYKGIYNVNLFFKDDAGRKVTYMLDSHLNELLTKRLIGEAFALRAWFQYDLLQKFGGRSVDGELLGFPIMLEPVKIWEMNPDEISKLEFKRASYDECVQQIIADCDSAYKYLPIAHRNFLVENTADLTVLGSQNWGRLDGITTVAIKALTYLTWASPRFNPDNDTERWQKAAEFALEVMSFKETVDNVSGGFNRLKSVNWFSPNDPEIVFASRYSDGSEAMEKAFWPGGFQGNGQVGATQDLVDAFGMADGYPVGKSPTYTFDPSNPYENRDPRLNSVIFYNDRSVSTGSSGRTYTFENWTGGKDAAGADSKNSRTNYHVKKFVYMGLNWSESTVNRMPHTKFFIRWTHMALAFAEAANEVGGPNCSIGGHTPAEVMGWIRARATYDGASGITDDRYLEDVAIAGTDAFREFVHNERRIETCFEGLRFFDLRRWSTTLGPLNTPVHGVTVTRLPNGDFSYDFNTVVEKRTFTSAYLPIPYKEVRNISGLAQNEGWESWQ